MRLLALVALGVSIYLLVKSISGGTLAGCGDEGGVDCDHVLSSRWSTWLGLPVSGPATGMYVALLSVLLLAGPKAPESRRRRLLPALLTMTVLTAGSALWFVGLQVFHLHSYCYYCLSVHACGVTIAVLAWGSWRSGSKGKQAVALRPQQVGLVVMTGLAGLGVLIAGQLLVEPDGFIVETFEPLDNTQVRAGDPAPPPPAGAGTFLTMPSEATPPEPTTPSETGLAPPPKVTVGPDQTPAPLPEVAVAPNQTPAPPSQSPAAPEVTAVRDNHMVDLVNGRVRFNRQEVPLIGPSDATYVIATLFDYTCPQCRKFHKKLVDVINRYPGQIAVAMFPVPFNPDCNPLVKKRKKTHEYACSLAQLALAVWHARPDLFETYDAYLTKDVKPPHPDQARARAAELLGEQALNQALTDPAITAFIQRDLKFYENVKKGAVPKLLLPKSALTGNISNVKRLYGYLEKQMQLQPNAAPIPPDPVAILLMDAGSLKTQRKLDEAIAKCREALALGPKDVRALYSLASLLQGTGKLDEAIGLYLRAIKVAPKSFAIHNNLANALNKQGNPAKAVEHFRLALAQKENYIPARNNLAWTLATHADPQVRQPAEAVRLALRTNELTGDKNPRILDTLATCYAADGQFDQAIATAQKSIELVGENAQAQRLIQTMNTRLQLYQQQKPYIQPPPDR